MKEKFNINIERILLNNLTWVMSISVCMIFLIDVWPHIANFLGLKNSYNFISTSFTISSIGAIFAFWFGYKRYERDKNIQIIEKLQSEKFTGKNFPETIGKWIIAFRLYQKGYIPKFIWEIIESENIGSLNRYLTEQLAFKGKSKEEINVQIEKISLDLGSFSVFEDTRYYILKTLKNRLHTKKQLQKYTSPVYQTIDQEKEVIDNLGMLIKVIEDVHNKFINNGLIH